MSDYAKKLQTNSGINFYHLSSAFQKCIRRGMEHEALWFGTELYISGYEEYVWFRMRVIVSEDIGLAEPHLPAQIAALYQTWSDFKKKKNNHGPERLPFAHAILLLVRAKKSRLVDNKLCYYFFLRDDVPQPELPDFIFDMHTIEGKQKGHGNEHAFDVGCHINNDALDIVPDEYEFRDLVKEMYKKQDASKAPKVTSKKRAQAPDVPNLFDNDPLKDE